MLEVVYSNNMVQLAARLADLQQSRPLSPLEAETVIVQSNELSRWLSLFLAQHHGIASHIDFPYPSAFIWALFRRLLPDIPKQSSFSTDAMAWKIYELLPACCNEPGFEAVTTYLGELDDLVKRYALAHRIADSFDQYLMYRPDWIQKWEQGEKPHWQAMLWQKVIAGNSNPKHRANLLTQLKVYLSSQQDISAGLPSRLAIFGLSALPPVYLELFELMARHCDVYLFILSPSEEYWGDLVDEKTRSKQLLSSPEQADYSTSGHPLLASLGKQGQEFFEQIQGCQHQDEQIFVRPQSVCLLGKLQHDIFELSQFENTNQQKHQIELEDDSIMIHACHSAMREIEVLHDQLLALFERHPELSSTDIVVMTPDVDIYSPWIDAVFACATAEHFIPYSIADSGIQQQSRIITAFNNLLDISQSRFDVESIVGLLECEAIQNKFSLHEDQLVLIRTWLQETQTRWALSADDKAALGLPATEANTWRAGLDRLLLGYAMPLSADGDNWGLFDGKLGFDGISGDRAETMAQLCAFVDCLDKYRQHLKGNYTAQQWQQQILSLLDDFFLASFNNSSDESELILIRKTLDSLVETVELAEFEQTMSIDLLKEWLSGHLDETQTQTRFMGHGVTFCGMVPMRSIPFKVVCLIGMNDDSYPRRQPSLGFDLLASDFRKGDRSRRDDDRYLFLESLLSAQSHFYISYVGASIYDNSAIPPSVLVSDVRDVLRQSFETVDSADIWQQISTQHPLQAFSERYFDGSSDKLFNYTSDQCPPSRTQEGDTPLWFEQALPEAEDSWKQVSITQLSKFFRHPARYLCQERLGLWLEIGEDQLETREPFTLDGLQAWQLREQLLHYRLQDKDLSEALPLIQATGVLPQGSVGNYEFNDQLDKVEAFSEKLLPEYPEQFLEPLSFELKFGEFTLKGQLDGLSNDGLFSYRMGKAKGGEFLVIWLRHLVLNCLQAEGVVCESRWITEDNDYHFQTVDNAKSLLEDLLIYYWQGLQQPLPLFPNTSFAYAQASLKGNKTDSAIDSAWNGNMYVTAEKEDLYYQQLYSSPPLDEQFKELALAIYEPIQAHLAGGKL
ncbi:MAG: exodeoxyribonuclease V subunit gamma [Gammaproteobacteria bacterium]|nr:MAG: exodeoxyribonuclease V subunit gamma [Gammaproteobacteria bacterium]